MILRTVVLCFSICWLSGCSESNSSVLSDPLGINGNWTSNCYLDPEAGRLYVRDEFSFSGDSVTTSFHQYDNSSCIGTPNSSGSFSGTYKVGKIIKTETGLEATEIDFEIDFQKNTVNFLDIIRVSGDEFLFGVFNNRGVRPAQLDFNIILSKQ